MKLTHDESRALAFIAGLLLLSAGVRLTTLPDPVELPAELDLDAHITATDSAVEAEARAAMPLADGERLDPNTAPTVELMRLPRVGPALADRIVETRDSARFASLDDLLRVPGIGPAVLDGIAPHLAIGEARLAGVAGPTTGAAARARGGPRPGSILGRSIRRPTDEEEPERVDPNRATARELEALPGVGPVLASRIVAYRDSVGPFDGPDALLAVPGIGAVTLEKIRDRLRFR